MSLMKKYFSLSTIILILLISSAYAAPIFHSEKFRVNTASEQSIIEIPVYMKDAQDLYAFKLDITYDNPGLMSFNSIVPGPLLKTGSVEVIDGSQIQLTTASSGKVSNVLISRKSVETGVTASGLLFTLRMNKIGAGISDFTLSGIELSNSLAQTVSNFEVYYLIPWDDTNTNIKYANEDINFYTTFEKKDGSSITATCNIEIDGVSYAMAYNTAAQAYKYTKRFTVAGEKTWKVTCSNEFVAYDKVVIIAQQCVPAAETCDGADNDCDGQTDESLTQQCGATDIGECSFGTQTCTNGNWGTCTGAVSSAAETCDGKDNDCDGQTDEGITAPNCDLTSGVCLNSKKVCGGAQGWLACTSVQYGTNYESTETKCDNLNNDCDTQTDEGCTCTDGATKQCGTTDIGECSFGTQTCTNGQWGACVGAVSSAMETCDGKDNDCDGNSDEELNAPNCELLSGVCLNSKQICAGAQGWQACTAQQYGINYEATETKCDTLNNDCDAQTDEGCTCINGATQQCGTTDIGECSYGTQTCANGQWGACVGAVSPAIESCDGKDNDCDGNSDEEVTAPNCQLELGVCQNSKKICETGSWEECTTSNYGPNYEISETSCDGLDNDCDGNIDTGCSCKDETTQICGTTDTGECSFGVQTCTEGKWGDCLGEKAAAAEICDSKDNDCDGIIDDDVCSSSNGGSGSGGGLGGGGGGSGGPSGCIENWECEEWTECTDGNKERNCQDTRRCGTEKNKPVTSANCDDSCTDGIKNNDEENIDCGGSCTAECLKEEPLVPVDNENKIEALLTEESIKESQVIIKYDNTGEGRKTGIEFNLEIKDKQGKIVADEYFGPLSIDENKEFVQAYNMPLYLLSKGQEYDLTMEVTEKGKTTTKLTSNVVLSEVPNKVFFSRVNIIFAGIILFILIVIIIFSVLFSRGEKK